ncbi:MAG: NADH-quinone oxidoreductase subunit L [Elusimicrobia bacterium]|nr:NADH-quinone oxidoreductase subunit L [Elusimicrobiota bacterium]
MTIENIVLLTVFVPVIGSLTIPVASLISKRARSVWSVLLGLATTVLPMMLIPFALGSNELIIRKSLFPGFDFVLVVDALSIFMSIVSSFIGFLIIIYSLGYTKHDENQNEYYLMVVMFIGSMMGLVYSANLIFMYLFWEIAAICCWRLIGFYRSSIQVLKADKAFLVTFFGAAMMLLGFIAIYAQTGTFDLTAMRGVMISSQAVLLILLGMFSKSATVPLHTWLPDAGVAPTPVTAILHAAVLVKIGVYAFARIFCYTFQIPEFWSHALPIIAVSSSLIAAAAAMMETDMKRILAYSTISQIGYIFLGFSEMNPIGITGGLLFILMHGLGKAGLFLCAGVVEHNTHKRDIRELGGLIITMPITAITFLLCSLSVIGIPPFGGFFSKFMVISSAVKNGQFLVASMGLFVAILTLFYLFRIFNAVFLGELKISVVEKTPLMLVVIVTLAALSLLAGIFVMYPANFANVASLEILKVIK